MPTIEDEADALVKENWRLRAINQKLETDKKAMAQGYVGIMALALVIGLALGFVLFTPLGVFLCK